MEFDFEVPTLASRRASQDGGATEAMLVVSPPGKKIYGCRFRVCSRNYERPGSTIGWRRYEARKRTPGIFVTEPLSSYVPAYMRERMSSFAAINALESTAR